MTETGSSIGDLGLIVREVLERPQLGPTDALSDWVKAELRKAWAASDVAAVKVLLCNVAQYLVFDDLRERIGGCVLCEGQHHEDLASLMLLGQMGRYEQIFAARANRKP